MGKDVRILALAMLLVFLIFGVATGGAKEQKITITMREFSFTPAKITLQAGAKAEIILVNKGKVKHEFMVYNVPKAGASREELHEWAEDTSYFKGVEVKVEGGGIEVEARDVLEVEVGPGKSAEVKFTPTRKGTFEFACLIEGHYEAGQKGTLTVK